MSRRWSPFAQKACAHLLLTCLCSHVPLSARAQQSVPELNGAEDDVESDESRVVVTKGRRVHGVFSEKAQRVERLEPEELQRRGVTNLSEALEASTSSASVSATGNTRGAIIDGLPASQIVVLLDGLPIASPSGSPQGPMVDLDSIAIVPSSIERIDIYRGAGPVGSGDAAGVVIDIISKRSPKASSLSLTTQWTAAPISGLDDESSGLAEQRYALGFNGVLTPTWSTQFSSQYVTRRALDVDRDGDVDRAGNEQAFGTITLTHRPRLNDFWRVQLVTTRTTSEVPGLGSAIFDDVVTRRGLRLRLKGRSWLSSNVKLDTHVDVGQDTNRFSKRVRSSQFMRLKSNTKLSSGIFSLGLTYFASTHDLGVEVVGRGWEARRDGESGALEPVPDGFIGVGVSDTWYLHSNVEIFARMFGRMSTDAGGTFNANVSGKYTLGAGFALRSSVARSVRVPTPEERYLFFDHSEVGYQVVGNAALEPERLASGQLGAVWTSKDKALGVEFMGFYHDLQDAIVTLPSEQDPALFTYENIAQAHTAGLQAVLQARALPGGFKALANYTYMPLAKEKGASEPLPNRSRHTGRVEVRRRFLDSRVEVWADVTARSASHVPTGLPPNPSSTLLGGGASYRHKWGRLMFDMNNLLNQTNAQWGPALGFNAMLSMQLGVTQ